MRGIVLLLLLPLQLNMHAQTGADSSATPLPRLTFKVNAGVLANPFKQAIAFTSDIRLARRVSVDAGAGAIFNSITFANTKGESYRGLRLRAGFKFHVLLEKSSTFYVGLEGRYQDVKHIVYKEVLRQGGQYIETLPVERTVLTQGLALRIGWQFYLGKSKRWIIDQYMGMGIDGHQVDVLLPPDGELVNTARFLSFEIPPGWSRRIALLMGVHVGVLLW